MTILPKLNDKNVNYVLETVEAVVDRTRDRRAGSKGEEQARGILLNELMKFCDETNEQGFITHPGAGTILHKILSVCLIASVFLFSVALSGGYVMPIAVSLILNLVVFGVYAHKFLFDGTVLDVIKLKKKSANIYGKRYCRGDTATRVVITAHVDSPMCLRSFALGNVTLNVLNLCSILGNTVLFCSQLFCLFAGVPVNSGLFDFLRVVCIIFVPFYIASIFIINPKHTASGVSSSLVPSGIALSVIKQLFDESFRYEKTEVCVLLTGSEYSGRAGAYAFAKKHKRLFSDVPTVFIPLEEITSSDNLVVMFKDGSGTKGSSQAASVIAQAAENLNIKLSREAALIGTSAFTPYALNGFEACSIGTTKKLTAKSMTATGDKITAVRRKTIGDVASLLLETLNYYDS
ncbi:MAG: hypothetical protein J6Q83_01230 [Clostridia bacterium]|nr:hypothetical protein [Clostridia bacterium]